MLYGYEYYAYDDTLGGRIFGAHLDTLGVLAALFTCLGSHWCRAAARSHCRAARSPRSLMDPVCALSAGHAFNDWEACATIGSALLRGSDNGGQSVHGRWTGASAARRAPYSAVSG